MSIEVRAQNTLSMTSVKAIKDATEQSAQLLATMEQYAEDAGTTLTGIYQDAEDAKTSAGIAQTSAEIAQTQLSLVENVVGVLQLVSEHGEFEKTEDTEVIPNKWYFTRSGTAPNYVYSIVQTPSGNPKAQGWYEITDIDEAIRNYVSSQLVLDTSGLWLKTTGMQTKILLSSTEGVVLYGADGQQVGKYGSSAQIGKNSGFHVVVNPADITFKDGTNADVVKFGTRTVSSRKITDIDSGYSRVYLREGNSLEDSSVGMTVFEQGGSEERGWTADLSGNNGLRVSHNYFTDLGTTINRNVDTEGVYCQYLYFKANGTNVELTDFVCEQGTDGIWTYRKWNNGDYDAWYEGSINVGTGTAMGGGYFHTSTSALTPPTFSQSVTSLAGASTGALLFAYVGHSATYQTYWWNGSSGAINNISVRLDMHGKWE